VSEPREITEQAVEAAVDAALAAIAAAGDSAALKAVRTEHTGEKLCPYCAAHSRFHRSFKRLIDRFGYYDMFLVDQQGRIVYTVVKEPDFGTSLLTGPYKDTGMARITKECLKANDSNTVILSDYEEYEPSRGKPSAFVCAPVMNTQTGKRFGAMIIQLSNKEIDRVVSGNRGWVRDGLGQSGDTGVVGPDYLIRSNARGFIEDPEKHLAGMRKRGDPEKQIEIMKQIIEISADQFYVIGINKLPLAYGVLKENFHNVPSQMPGSWSYPDPAPTNPCQYYID